MSTKFAFTPIPPSRNDAQRPRGVPALAGTWQGRFIDQDGATEAFTLLRDASVDAAVAGRFLFFSTPSVAPTGVRLLDANEHAFVALVGPYYDAREHAEVVTVLEGVRNGTVLEGTWYTRLHNWRETLRSGRFVARCIESAHRAA
ncbi:MAG TPA: hypothetical protein VLE53_02090 [Gemmatimonadaceae bacterium]|nr:hypothetical protein [Gemmatimonadaceae bacterium]